MSNEENLETVRSNMEALLAEHATVKIGEYTIPLIGVPEEASMVMCDGCKGIFHLYPRQVDAGTVKFICDRCYLDIEEEGHGP